MSSHSFDVTTAEFNEKVVAASRRVPVLVDFWADWCQPCRVLKPILEKLAAEYGGRFLLAKVDSDRNPELSAQYGVRGIPAVKAFVDGRLADEFTGALPEGQVREFIDGLVPSPAEPLRQEAIAAYQRGDAAAARELLARAVDMDPRNEDACLDYAEVCLETGAAEAAKAALTAIAAVAYGARDQARVESLQARLALASAAGGEPAALRVRIAADPADLEARLQLANNLALARDYRGAFEQLLEIVRRDRQWQDEAGRKGMLTLFTLLAAQPEQDGLVREYRVALARTLN